MMANEGTDPVRVVLIERMEKKAQANQDDLLWSFARLLRYTDARILTLVAESMEVMSDRWHGIHNQLVNQMSKSFDPPILVLDPASIPRLSMGPGEIQSVGRFTCNPVWCCLTSPKHEPNAHCCQHHRPRKLTWRERLTGWTQPE